MRVLLVHSDSRPFEVERFGDAWARAGGKPGELVPVTPSTAATVAGRPASAHGLLLTGGPDVEPWRYLSSPERGVELHLDPARDALDLELLARADEQHWAVLAICYGCQILAVSRGCPLLQDLERVGRSGHTVREPKDHLAHEVMVRQQSRLLAFAAPHLAVNSRHRQAIGLPVPGVVVAATAPDGVIEAIEVHEEGRFVLGVQWHPENLTQEPHVELFRRFRAACLKRSLES
jgi:putative glutamine amidotransferase